MSQSLEDRIERLEQRRTWLLAGIALTGFVALWLLFKTTLNLKAEQPSALRTKQLEIVDSDGVVRLKFGAPLPDATFGDYMDKDRARMMVTADNKTKLVLDGGILKNQVLILVDADGATLLEAHDGDAARPAGPTVLS